MRYYGVKPACQAQIIRHGGFLTGSLWSPIFDLSRREN